MPKCVCSKTIKFMTCPKKANKKSGMTALNAVRFDRLFRRSEKPQRRVRFPYSKRLQSGSYGGSAPKRRAISCRSISGDICAGRLCFSTWSPTEAALRKRVCASGKRNIPIPCAFFTTKKLYSQAFQQGMKMRNLKHSKGGGS